MKTYPISIPMHRLWAARKNIAELSRIAPLVETYINAMVERSDDTCVVIHSRTVAKAIGEDSALVHEMIMQIDGGHNGLTVQKTTYHKM
ncbi:MAG TPA: hypothetical protein VF800_30745 [Telluria sp.]|jgi:hypothetical protein